MSAVTDAVAAVLRRLGEAQQAGHPISVLQAVDDASRAGEIDPAMAADVARTAAAIAGGAGTVAVQSAQARGQLAMPSWVKVAGIGVGLYLLWKVVR